MKQSIQMLLLTLFFVSCSYESDGSPCETDTATNIDAVTGVHPIVAFHSGKCLDIVGSDDEEKKKENAELNQWTCFGYQSQQWELEKDGEGLFSIRSNYSNRCLSAETAQQGEKVSLETCTESESQKWLLKPFGDNNFAIINGKNGSSDNNGMCLDVVDAKVTDGQRIQIWNCHDGYNQRWKFDSIYDVEKLCAGTRPTPEICDGEDNDCDGDIDEGCECDIGTTQTCGTSLGACETGTQSCVDGRWGECVGATFPTEDVCDGEDNDCDGDIDEGCECKTGTPQTCGISIGVCKTGTQTCTDGHWGECVDAVLPVAEECDGKDNDCDGDIDEGCECRHETVRWCNSGEGECASGKQTCEDGLWGPCVAQQSPEAETCDGIDNDCDGVIDNGFNLDTPCDSIGECPKRRVCSNDGKSSVCSEDEDLFEDEKCDGIDNDCDGLVDLVSEGGSLKSVCSCQARLLSGGKVVDASAEDNPNFCTPTQCKGIVPHLKVDGICYPVCRSGSSDPDGDGWGWEDGASCLVENSPRAQAATPCDDSGSSEGFMSVTYCLDCSGDGELPFAMCQTELQYDLRAFGRGEEWIWVDYTYSAVGPARIPVNLWFDTGGGGRRKRLPLVRIGDAPGRYERLLRIDEACFTASELFGSSCEGEGQRCSHCGEKEVCGATSECGDYDLSQAWLQVAAEFCGQGIGEQSGTVTLHEVKLVEPNCEE